MSENALSDIRALLVNDSDHVSSLLRVVLSAAGIRDVTIMADVDAALEFMKESSPDLALVDIELDTGSGLDFVRKVRQDEDGPNRYLPIVVVTAHSSRRWVMDAIRTGANEFVGLPLSPARLIERIHFAVFVGRPFVTTADYFGPCRRRFADPGYGGPERRSEASREATSADRERMKKAMR